MIRKVMRLQPARSVYLHAATLKVLHKLEINDTLELIQKTEDRNTLISLEFCSACDNPLQHAQRAVWKREDKKYSVL